MLLEYYDVCRCGICNLQRTVVEQFEEWIRVNGVGGSEVYDVIPVFASSTGYAPSTLRRYRPALRRYVECVSEYDNGVVVRW